MISRANASMFLSLEVEEEKPANGRPWPHDVTTNIRVPVPGVLFRDLFVTLNYRMKTAKGPISNLKAELGEIGWMMPGLLPDDTRITCSAVGLEINFDIHCSIEFKLGSLQKDGLAVPLPLPKHRCLVTGWFNVGNKTHFARFHEFGEI